jgi:hypothetical protein
MVLMRWGLIPFWILKTNSGGGADVSEKTDFAGAVSKSLGMSAAHPLRFSAVNLELRAAQI